MYLFKRLMVCAFLALAFMRAEAAAPDLAGTWQGKLQVDPQTALTLQFIFTKQPDGSYTAVLDSPDNGAIKHVAAGSVTWDQSALKVQVPSLSGAYAGSLKGTNIEGQWTQEGSSLPLLLSPYQKPKLSKAAIDTLVGGWHGPVSIPNGNSLTFNINFKADPQGELGGTLGVVEQGNRQLPISDVQFAGGKLDFKVAAVAGELTATYADGTFTGSWRQGPITAPSLPVTLKRGEATMPVYALKLPSAQFASIAGSWQGTLSVTPPQGKTVQVRIILRFETDKQARNVGSIDVEPVGSPAPGAKGVPITEVNLQDGKFHIKMNSIFTEYSATVTAGKMEGQWTQGAMVNPLTLTRQ